MHMVAVAEIKEAAVVISVEVGDSPEVTITHHVDFRITEGLRTMVMAAGMAEELMEGMAADTEEGMVEELMEGMAADTEEGMVEELMEGMAADTIDIITEGMHQEGPYSELFWEE